MTNSERANVHLLLSQFRGRKVACKHQLMKKTKWNERKLDRVKRHARAFLTSKEQEWLEQQGYGVRLVWTRVDESHCGRKHCNSVFSLAVVREDIEEPIEHIRKTINGLTDFSNDMNAPFLVVERNEFERLVAEENAKSEWKAQIKSELARLNDLLA